MNLSRRSFISDALAAAGLALLPTLPARALPRLKDWESKADLDGWARRHLNALMWGDGLPTTCVDYALDFQEQAYRDGYRMSVCYAQSGYLTEGIRVTDIPGKHWGNLAIAENHIFFVEPQAAAFKVTNLGPIQERRW